MYLFLSYLAYLTSFCDGLDTFDCLDSAHRNSLCRRPNLYGDSSSYFSASSAARSPSSGVRSLLVSTLKPTLQDCTLRLAVVYLLLSSRYD